MDEKESLALKSGVGPLPSDLRRSTGAKNTCAKNFTGLESLSRLRSEVRNLRSRMFVPHIAIHVRKHNRHNRKHDGSEDARLRTYGPSRQPRWPFEATTKEAVIGGNAAVGHAIEKCFAPNPTRRGILQPTTGFLSATGTGRTVVRTSLQKALRPCSPPGLPMCAIPNSTDSRIAAGQNRIPVVSVYCR